MSFQTPVFKRTRSTLDHMWSPGTRHVSLKDDSMATTATSPPRLIRSRSHTRPGAPAGEVVPPLLRSRSRSRIRAGSRLAQVASPTMTRAAPQPDLSSPPPLSFERGARAGLFQDSLNLLGVGATLRSLPSYCPRGLCCLVEKTKLGLGNMTPHPRYAFTYFQRRNVLHHHRIQNTHKTNLYTTWLQGHQQSFNALEEAAGRDLPSQR